MGFLETTSSWLLSTKIGLFFSFIIRLFSEAEFNLRSLSTNILFSGPFREKFRNSRPFLSNGSKNCSRGNFWHAVITCIFVLFTNSLLCHFRCPNKGFMQPNKAFFEIINIVARLGHHGILPGSHAQGVPGQGHGGRAYDGGGEGHKGLAVNHGQFGQVLCQGCSPLSTSGQAGQVIYKKLRTPRTNCSIRNTWRFEYVPSVM